MKILFVGNANCTRSVMAETYFKHLCKQNKLDEEVQVASAGIDVKEESTAATEVFEIMKGLGFSLEAHTPRQLQSELVDESDHIIAMDKEQIAYLAKNFPKATDKCRLILSLLESPDELDKPQVGDMEAFEKCFLSMMPALAELVDRLQRSQQ